MDKIILKSMDISKIILKPIAGAIKSMCDNEAIIFCAAHMCDVEYEHNGRVHTVKYENLAEIIDVEC